MSLATQGFGGTGIATHGFGVTPAGEEEAVTTSGKTYQFYGVPTQEAIDRRNWELYGIPIPSKEPVAEPEIVAEEVVTPHTEEEKRRYRELAEQQAVISKFGVPLLPTEIKRVREGMLSIGDIMPKEKHWMDEDEEAIVLLMMQM